MCHTPAPTCPPGEFRCDNGHCISLVQVCDRNDDCSDNSDEKGCGECEDMLRCEKINFDPFSRWCVSAQLGFTQLLHAPSRGNVKEVTVPFVDGAFFTAQIRTKIKSYDYNYVWASHIYS